MAHRILSPWQCDSDHDYYDQFDRDETENDEPPEDWREPEDGDCEYWESNCYGRG